MIIKSLLGWTYRLMSNNPIPQDVIRAFRNKSKGDRPSEVARRTYVCVLKCLVPEKPKQSGLPWPFLIVGNSATLDRSSAKTSVASLSEETKSRARHFNGSVW